MTIFREYERYKDGFSYDGPIVGGIISIFEGSGKSPIITKETIKGSQKKVKDFLILSSNMEGALLYIQDQLQEIKNNQKKVSGGLFYFCQYGGSKTQFLNYVLSEIQDKIQDCVVLLFEDIEELKPQILFNKLKQSIYFTISNLPRFKSDEKEYFGLINKIEEISATINLDLKLSSNSKNIVERVGYVKNQLNKNPKLRDILKEAIELVNTSILVDSESIIKKIIEMMKVLTEYGISFLFLYDELDFWIDDSDSDQLLFSQNFKQLEKTLKYIFEISQHEIKLFHLFACTERIKKLLDTNRALYSSSSSAGSRLMQIYDRSNIIIESGNYEEKIEQALSKIAAFFSLSNDKFQIDEEFLTRTLEKLKQKYNSYDRRTINGQIIKFLKVYRYLKIPLEKGLKEWKSDVTKYGDLIHRYIERILKEMEIQFIRGDFPTELNKKNSDKIDGYFLNYDDKKKEIKTYVEIKISKKFSGDKSSQALQWVQIKKEPIIMIIFSEDTLDEINQEIIKFAEKNGFTQNDTEKIKIMHISTSYAFCPIIGIENVLTDHSKLIEFYQNFGLWLDFFGDFNIKYQKLREALGFSYEKFKPKDKIEQGEKGKKDVKQEKKKELSTDAKICIELLAALYKEGKMSKSGRLSKTTIEKIGKDNLISIPNINLLYDKMGNCGIGKKSDSCFTFSPDILNKEHIEDYIKICESKFE